MKLIKKVLPFFFLSQFLFASDGDSITLSISIDPNLTYTNIKVQNNAFGISKEIKQPLTIIKIPTYKEPISAFIVLQGANMKYTSVFLNDYDLSIQFLKDSVLFEDDENQRFTEYLSKRKEIRSYTEADLLKKVEDSLSISFIKNNSNLFSALEVLEGLIIQANHNINTYQTLFENFKNEKLRTYSIYKRIQWKLANFHKKLKEGSDLTGKKIKVYNHKGIPYYMNSLVAKEKSTIFLVCNKGCYACDRDLIYISENKVKIDSSYNIKYISIEENHETALQHIEASERQNYHYITDGILSEFVFLLNITKTPTYIEVTPNAIIADLEFNIRYLENEIPDFPFVIEREINVNNFILYHETDKVEVINKEMFEKILKTWKENALSSIRIIASTDTIGNYIYNKELSQKRANFVAKSLKEKGIVADKIYITGIGEIHENSLEASRSTKVEIIENQKHVFKPHETINFLKIFFQGAFSSIIPESKPYLNELLEIMKQNSSLKIKITGHICCNIGEGEGVDLKTNEKNLSWARAKVVKDFLVNNGIDETRLKIEGMAHKKPKYKGSLEVEKFNRRVEIVVLDY